MFHVTKLSIAQAVVESTFEPAAGVTEAWPDESFVAFLGQMVHHQSNGRDEQRAAPRVQLEKPEPESFLALVHACGPQVPEIGKTINVSPRAN